MTNGRLSIPVQRPNGTANSGTVSSTSSVWFSPFLFDDSVRRIVAFL